MPDSKTSIAVTLRDDHVTITRNWCCTTYTLDAAKELLGALHEILVIGAISEYQNQAYADEKDEYEARRDAAYALERENRKGYRVGPTEVSAELKAIIKDLTPPVPPPVRR